MTFARCIFCNVQYLTTRIHKGSKKACVQPSMPNDPKTSEFGQKDSIQQLVAAGS